MPKTFLVEILKCVIIDTEECKTVLGTVGRPNKTTKFYNWLRNMDKTGIESVKHLKVRYKIIKNALLSK